MKKWMFRIVAVLLVLLLCPVAHATEVEPMAIFTVEDLMAIKDNPAGSYIMMADLDLSGIDWVPVDLDGGSFDGNGHSILNLTINSVGNTTDTSYDGNRKAYDTNFAGLFGIIKNANISNLSLINVRGNINADAPCFLGGVAGAMFDSKVMDCNVSGILELTAWDRMFGVGGIVGYGSGSIERCTADMTLVCTDTSEDVRDEQFMGGACAAGYVSVIDSSVTIAGYVSEYGYVHNGGLLGMLMEITPGNGQKGYMTGNSVKGKITFFECNGSRRAYCEAYVGETLAYNYVRRDNVADFKRDERKDFSVILRPEMCENPIYEESVVAPSCDSFGYTEYKCQDCDYGYTDKYTLTQHTISDWTATKAPTLDENGISVAICTGCGIEFTREEPKLESTEPETQPTEPASATVSVAESNETEAAKENISPEMIWIPVLLAILFVVGIALRFWQSRFN